MQNIRVTEVFRLELIPTTFFFAPGSAVNALSDLFATAFGSRDGQKEAVTQAQGRSGHYYR